MAALANRAGMDSLYVKRDELTNDTLGGSVVRKLEFVLAAAERKNKVNVITHGSLGNDLSSALAFHAPPLGIKPQCIAHPQGTTTKHQRYLEDAIQHGLHVKRTRMPLETALRAHLGRMNLWRKKVHYIPPGGGPHGALGFVEAAFELAEQIQAGQCPQPDTIFVPARSGATMAGLAVGLAILDLDITVVGVALQPRWQTNLRRIRYLADRTVALLRGAGCRKAVPPTPERMVLLTDIASSASGEPTQPTSAAVSLARDAERLHLDPQGSGPVLTAILDQALTWNDFRRSKVLFWNTTADR